MIKGRVVIDRKTKNLLKRIKTNEIAIISHRDLDHISGQALVEKHVAAVFNLFPSISGRYPNQGPVILMQAGIPIIDLYQGDFFSILKDGDQIVFDNGKIYKDGKIIGRGVKLSEKEIESRLRKARDNLEDELNKFIDNTLKYARREKNLIFDIPVPDTGINFKDRHALIVVRGKDYKEDLEAIRPYIQEMDPVIVAVDGGADACLFFGYTPDLIVGDMDSVSDRALQSGSKIVVHAYPDGRAPGMKRIKELGLKATVFPAPGTSEDIAMLLAYEKGAELITAVGTHSNMIDFLEKGRPGMASTLLVRLKIGDKLVDAKGVSKLYQSRIHYRYWVQVILSILLPLTFIGFFSPALKQLLQLIAIKIGLIINF